MEIKRYFTMDANKDLKRKQDLLKREIIDKNYDKTSFINFCLTKKENGDDLNNWTLGELTIVICQFLAKQEKSEIKQDNNNIKLENDELKKENIENLEKFNLDAYQNCKEKIINCRKLEETQLNKNKIIITIRNPKEVDGGVFGKKYILYEVLTNPLGWVVYRRYSDFDSLRKLISKQFPSFYIPPLPDKKLGNKNFDQNFIEKRMKLLNLFINNLVQSESFKASDILMAFLSYEDRGKFESKFKEYGSMQYSSYVEEYKTLDGKAIISFDEGNEKKFNNISKYFRLQEQIFERLNFSLKIFNNNMKAVEESLQNVQKNFEILHALNTRALMNEVITKSYQEMSRFFGNYKKILIKHKEMIKKHMKTFFKYIYIESKAYNELIERREDLRNKFITENQKVTAKKEKVFATGDINKFELGDDRNIDKERILKDKPYAFEYICKSDTNGLLKIYNQLGYANKMNIVELKKMINEYCVRCINNIKNFDAEFYPTINDFITSWSNMETFVMSAKLPQ